MMGMRLTLTIKLAKPAAAETVLPLTEEWVTEHKRVSFPIPGSRKRYRHRVDRVLVWALPCMAKHVHAFYATEGPPLRELLTEAQCEMLDEALVQFLKQAQQRKAA